MGVFVEWVLVVGFGRGGLVTDEGCVVVVGLVAVEGLDRTNECSILCNGERGKKEYLALCDAD